MIAKPFDLTRIGSGIRACNGVVWMLAMGCAAASAEAVGWDTKADKLHVSSILPLRCAKEPSSMTLRLIPHNRIFMLTAGGDAAFIVVISRGAARRV